MSIAKHLTSLEREGLIEQWHDRHIVAGQEWSNVIDERLRTSDVILLLISPDFIASEYCYNIEMATALDLHNRGRSLVIPIFIRPTVFEGAPFAKLQGLPRDGRAIAVWPNEDEALATVIQELKGSVLRLRDTKRLGGHPNPHALTAAKNDHEKIRSYHRAFLRPAFSIPCIFKGSLKHLDNALESMTEALATGIVHTRGRTAAYPIAPRIEFESDLFRKALDQVAWLLSMLRRRISEINHFLAATASSVPQSNFIGRQSPDKIHHMEFF